MFKKLKATTSLVEGVQSIDRVLKENAKKAEDLAESKRQEFLDCLRAIASHLEDLTKAIREAK